MKGKEDQEKDVSGEADQVLTPRVAPYREKPRLQIKTQAGKERAALALVHFYQSIANRGRREFSEGKTAILASFMLTVLALSLERQFVGHEGVIVCQFMLAVSCVLAWVAFVKFCMARGEFSTSVRGTILFLAARTWACLFFFWFLFKVAARWLL